MKYGILSGVAATALIATSAFGEEVRVYNWSDYIDESLLQKFEDETGIDLIYDVFDSNEVLETKMLAGGSGYDVVVPSGTFLQRQISAGAFQKLDKSKLPNIANMWDTINTRVAKYDPGNEYAINYMWGTTGLGVNINKVKEVLGEDAPVDSLSLVLDPANMEKLAECGVQFLDAPAEMIPAALKYIGENPDAQDVETIEKAEPVLTAIALMWFDNMAIPVDAPNSDGAHKFLNFIMDAQNMAAASNYVYYANGNKASQEFLVEDVIGDSAIYPDAATLENLYTTSPYAPKVQRVVTRLWTKVKSGT